MCLPDIRLGTCIQGIPDLVTFSAVWFVSANLCQQTISLTKVPERDRLQAHVHAAVRIRLPNSQIIRHLHVVQYSGRHNYHMFLGRCLSYKSVFLPQVFPRFAP